MDECLDWQARELPRRHPYSFRGFMEQHFLRPHRSRPSPCRKKTASGSPPATWTRCASASPPRPSTSPTAAGGRTDTSPTTRPRRHPFSPVTIDDVRNSSVRVQDNNLDTMLALAQRTFGAAYQFVPPMSVTLGVCECLSASQGAAVQRHRRVETDRPTRGAVSARSPRTTPITLVAAAPRMP